MIFHVHYYDKIILLENIDGIITELSMEQYELLKLFNKGYDNESVIKTLLSNETLSKEQVKLLNDNINGFRSICENQDLFLDDNFTETGETGKYYPRVLNLELTDKCNFYCGHCYKEAKIQNKVFLSEKILDKLYSEYAGKIAVLHLTGGEPLLYPKLDKYVRKLSEKFCINITTNGSLVHTWSEEMISKVNNFQISLYGYDEESYEYVTKTKGSFKKVIQTMDRLNELGKFFTIGITLNKVVCDNIEKYITLLKKYNVSKIIFSLAANVGRGKEVSFWNITNGDLEHLVSYMRQNATLKSNYESLSLDDEESTECNENDCTAGRSQITVSEKGKLIYCNVLDHDFFSMGSFEQLEKHVQKGLEVGIFHKKINEYRTCQDCKNHICPLINSNK